MEDNLEELYAKLWTVITELSENHKPLAVAGVMTAQAMTIYKTVLSPEEYEMIAESIYNSRDKVKKLEGPILQ
jgi:PHD/YefM family antitoxin component YafN of YafNO toxin-antitoxin module